MSKELTFWFENVDIVKNNARFKFTYRCTTVSKTIMRPKSTLNNANLRENLILKKESSTNFI